MTTRSTITRAALAVALLTLAGILIWVRVTRVSSGQPSDVPILLSALLALVAAGLLFVRRGIGAAVAMVAALLGAFWGLFLSVCLFCAPPPLSAEAIALFVAAGLAFALAVVELVTLGLAWVAIAIVVAVLAFAGTVGIVVAGLIVAAVVVWLIVRRRGSRSGA